MYLDTWNVVSGSASDTGGLGGLGISLGDASDILQLVSNRQREMRNKPRPSQEYIIEKFSKPMGIKPKRGVVLDADKEIQVGLTGLQDDKFDLSVDDFDFDFDEDCSTELVNESAVEIKSDTVEKDEKAKAIEIENEEDSQLDRDLASMELYKALQTEAIGHDDNTMDDPLDGWDEEDEYDEEPDEDEEDPLADWDEEDEFDEDSESEDEDSEDDILDDALGDDLDDEEDEPAPKVEPKPAPKFKSLAELRAEAKQKEREEEAARLRKEQEQNKPQAEPIKSAPKFKSLAELRAEAKQKEREEEAARLQNGHEQNKPAEPIKPIKAETPKVIDPLDLEDDPLDDEEDPLADWDEEDEGFDDESETEDDILDDALGDEDDWEDEDEPEPIKPNKEFRQPDTPKSVAIKENPKPEPIKPTVQEVEVQSDKEKELLARLERARKLAEEERLHKLELEVLAAENEADRLARENKEIKKAEPKVKKVEQKPKQTEPTKPKVKHVSKADELDNVVAVPPRRPSKIDMYTAMKDNELYIEVRKFLKKREIQKKPADVKELNEEFGAANIKKLILKSYLISTGKGVTIGR